jgi:methionyl-tRNA formyltransferase
VRIAFFGLPLAALLLAKDGHIIAYAGVCRKGAAGARRLAKVADVMEVMPDTSRPVVLDRVRAAGPDLVVSWFWTKKLPVDVRSAAPLGAIGVHPSLLPRHRGPDPYFWAVRLGDRQAGVTAHLLDDGYDTGAVLAQRAIDIDPQWNAWTLAKRLDRPSLGLLREVVQLFAEGRPPEPVAQNEASTTAAPAPTEDELAIDWRSSADEIVALVRAAGPWPGATFTLGDEIVVLERASVTADVPVALRPGEAWVQRDGRAAVRTGRGGVVLLAGRDDGDASIDETGWAERVKRIREP